MIAGSGSVFEQAARRVVELLATPPGSTAYERYQDDPVGFVREVLRGQPWSKQREILEAIHDHTRVSVRSCHGVGKTWTAVAAVLWFLYTRAPVTVLTTAPTARQVREILWREIRLLHLRAGLPGECQIQRLDLAEDRFALGLSTDEPDRFQGFHAQHVLVIADEAAGVPKTIFDAIDGCLTSAEAKLLLLGNPTALSGRFYESHHRGRAAYHCLAVSAFDAPAFSGEPVAENLVKGLVTPEWAEARRLEWGEDSPLYQARVLGQFSTEGDDTLIPLGWVEAAMERGDEAPLDEPSDKPIEPGAEAVCEADEPDAEAVCEADEPDEPEEPEPVEIGVDLARYGSCESVAVVRKGEAVLVVVAWRKADLMQSAGRVADLIRKHDPQRVKVDEVGLGAGVVDRLREQGWSCVEGVNVGGAPADRERFTLLRDEVYFSLRERFSEGRISLPKDETLASQLSALRYSYSSDGRLRVETKESLRGRGLPSPDRADALALAWYQPPAGPVWRFW